MDGQLQNVISIGGGYMEATCRKCGEKSLLSKGDDFFAEGDGDGKIWPVCSRCYTGQRASKETHKQTLRDHGIDVD